MSGMFNTHTTFTRVLWESPDTHIVIFEDIVPNVLSLWHLVTLLIVTGSEGRSHLRGKRSNISYCIRLPIRLKREKLKRFSFTLPWCVKGNLLYSWSPWHYTLTGGCSWFAVSHQPRKRLNLGLWFCSWRKLNGKRTAATYIDTKMIFGHCRGTFTLFCSIDGFTFAFASLLGISPNSISND